MNRASFVLAALALSACTGPSGPQGPPGPSGPPYSRSASYCNTTSADAAPSNSWTLFVRCTNVPDIPIEGWCYEPQGLPTGMFRSADAPVDWADTAKAAGWTCGWGWQGGVTPTPFPAVVEICCATPQ